MISILQTAMSFALAATKLIDLVSNYEKGIISEEDMNKQAEQIKSWYTDAESADLKMFADADAKK